MSDDSAPESDAVTAFYAKGLERDRLLSGSGVLEFARTCNLLERHLPPAPATVADIGGGPGRYAHWLAERGYRVLLIDPVPLHIEQALETSRRGAVELAVAQVGDARALPLAAATADAVLLLGPLYHLPERRDRHQALLEARRVVRPGGPILGAAISRYASTLDGLRAGYLEDPVFAGLASEDRRTGRHRNPTGDLAYFTTAFFHHPDELAAEYVSAGLLHEATLAVEGPAWLLSDLDARLADERSRSALLTGLEAIEAEPTLVGASAHLLAIGRRPPG